MFKKEGGGSKTQELHSRVPLGPYVSTRTFIFLALQAVTPGLVKSGEVWWDGLRSLDHHWGGFEGWPGEVHMVVCRLGEGMW